jgi:hypothetical protein
VRIVSQESHAEYIIYRNQWIIHEQ